MLVLFGLIISLIVYAFVLSTQNVNLLKPHRSIAFVGLRNYISLARDASFANSVRVTLLFTFVTTALALLLAMALALALDRPFRGRRLVRSLALVPWMIPPVVSGLMWRWLYMDEGGFINGVLLQVGLIRSPILWLGRPHTAFWAIVIQHVWRSIPFLSLIFLAGLQGIPRELHESARVDGANAWQCLWRITLPLLRPVVLTALVIKTMISFLVFDVIYTLTGGGPLDATMVLSLLAYRQAFEGFTFSYSAATSFCILFFSLLLTLLYVRLFGTGQA